MFAGKYIIFGMDKKAHTVYNEMGDYFSITTDGKSINEWIDFRGASSSISEIDDDFNKINKEEVFNRLLTEAEDAMVENGISLDDALGKISKGSIETNLENPIAICDEERIKHMLIRTSRDDVFAYVMYFKEEDRYWLPHTYPIGDAGYLYSHLNDMDSFIRNVMIPFFDAGEFEFKDEEFIGMIKEIGLKDLDEKRKKYA